MRLLLKLVIKSQPRLSMEEEGEGRASVKRDLSSFLAKVEEIGMAEQLHPRAQESQYTSVSSTSDSVLLKMSAAIS